MIYRILIVDDETAIKKGLSMLIQKALPNCVIDGTASDGAEAIGMIRESVPDIVITDIKMPVCNGLELSKYLFENYPDVKIIMLTGFADFEYAQTAIKYRVSDYLLKPTSRDKLVNTITKLQSEIADERKKRGFLEKNSALFMERILQEISSGAITDEYLDSISAYWPASNSTYYCISFQFKNSESHGKNHIALIRSILEQLPNNFIFRYSNAINCLYFKLSEESPEESSIVSFAQEIVNLCNFLYGITVSSGISQAKYSPNDICAASLEAYSALLSNFFSEQSVSLYNPEMFPPSQYSSSVFRTALFELEKAIDDQNYSASNEMIRSMFASFQTNHISSSQVKYISGQIYYVLIRVLLRKGTAEIQPDFLDLLDQSMKAEDLQNSLLQLVNQIQQSVVQAGKQLSQMTKHATEYIALHLSDDLSLETIADVVNANPSYLSRIFKKECGETLTEYITRMRIEKAKELLLQPDQLIYQISESTGFNDPAYFSTIFKKQAGLTPKEYRQRYM